MNLKAPSDTVSGGSEAPSAQNILCADDGSIPLWIPMGDARVFAWFHPAKNIALQNIPVILCNTFGSEAMLLHPSYRQFAIDLAEAGFPCIRFDYPGTGDSSGNSRDSNLLSSWIDSIECVIDYIKNLTDSDHVALYGALLGGTLALQVASKRNDIRNVMTWAPYLSGKNFLRTTKLQSKIVTANTDNLRAPDWQEGDIEAFGFLISQEFANDLNNINLLKTEFKNEFKALVFAKDSSGIEKKLAQKLSEFHIDLNYEPTPPCDIVAVLDRMHITPQLNQAIIRWLGDNQLPPQISKKHQPSLPELSQTYCDQTLDWSEHFAFSQSENLVKIFSVVTRPNITDNRSTTGIILVNGGANHHVGINRNYTEWARGWASSGFTVVRMDICGLGDSPAKPNEQRNMLYLNSTTDDLVRVSKMIKQQMGLKNLILVGLCGGAYQSFRCALHCELIDAVVMINPLRFQKPPQGDDGRKTMGSVQQLLSTISFANYVHFFLNHQNWKTLLNWRGKSLSLLKSAALQLLRQFDYKFNQAPLADNCVANDFLALTRRKVHVFLLCGSNEVILHYFKVALACQWRKLRKSQYFSFSEIDNTTHILAPLWSQQKAFQLITENINRINGTFTKGGKDDVVS